MILYTTNCPKCMALERKLIEKGFDFQYQYNVTLMQQKGFTTVPMLEVGDENLNFDQAMEWLNNQ